MIVIGLFQIGVGIGLIAASTVVRRHRGAGAAATVVFLVLWAINTRLVTTMMVPADVPDGGGVPVSAAVAVSMVFAIGSVTGMFVRWLAARRHPRGWYPDPLTDASRWRYWNGRAWTDLTSPREAAGTLPTPAPFLAREPAAALGTEHAPSAQASPDGHGRVSTGGP